MRTLEEISKEEVGVVQDIIALKPYYGLGYSEVNQELGLLAKRRKELREKWKSEKRKSLKRTG